MSDKIINEITALAFGDAIRFGLFFLVLRYVDERMGTEVMALMGFVLFFFKGSY